MTAPATPIRETLLSVIKEQQPRDNSTNLQSGSVLRAVRDRLGLVTGDRAAEQMVLTQFHDLFRTGFLAWGLNFDNSEPPFFHVTTRGRELLARFSRDPGNPDGYLAYVNSVARLNDICRSYLGEALECYVAGLHKAAAVMVGGAAESAVLELRDTLTSKLTALTKPIPPKLTDWRIKTVLDGLQDRLTAERKNFSVGLREAFDSYWPAFTQQIRTVRNDAGHPTSIAPVTPEAVHAALLLLPELLRLQCSLCDWVSAELK